MTAFLSAIGSFVAGLFAVNIPGVNISMGVLILGAWLLYAVGYAVMHLFFDGGGDN